MKAVAVVIVCAITLLAVAHARAVTLDTVRLATDPPATVSVHDVDLAPTEPSRPVAVLSEPSGLLALALVMVTLGVGVVMRLAQELRALVSHCAQYKIELGGLRRWWTAHRRDAR